MKKLIILAVPAVVIVTLLFIFQPWKPTAPSDEHTTVVKFGMLPYGDCTQAIIGVEKGWFKEVGIDLQYEMIKNENVVPFLQNGTLDVCAGAAGFFYPAYDTAPGLGLFVFGDIFQGFAIMAQPDLGCKSYQEFLKEGLSSEAAFKATVAQMKGKVFTYPPNTVIKPFIDIVLEKGGITRGDLTVMEQDDPLTVNAMRNKRAHFETAGAPSRIIMQREGFKPIITAMDIARSAKPSHKSPELATVLPDGWATTRKMFDERRDTLLRLASVSFRINDLIVNSPDEALAIHMPYLSRMLGEKFTLEDGKIIYEALDPFYTFEQEKPWFHDPNDPFFYKHVNGAALQSFIDKGVFRTKKPDIEEFIFADDIYLELERLKAEADKEFARIDREGLARDEPRKALYDKAKRQYRIYNFFDAVRLAKQVVGAS